MPKKIERDALDGIKDDQYEAKAYIIDGSKKVTEYCFHGIKKTTFTKKVVVMWVKIFLAVFVESHF